MKYEDYKLELCYFSNHNELWNDVEMNEVLSTFPETKNDDIKIDALNKLSDDIKNDVIKKSTYGKLNANSMCSYINKNKFFGYRKGSTYHTAGLTIHICGEERIINTLSDVLRLLEILKDNKRRINYLCNIYRKKEFTANRDREIKEYENANIERIEQGKRTKEKMYSTEIIICKDLKLSYNGHYYNAESKRLNGSDYIDYNRYGEISKKYNKELLSVETGKELEIIFDELSKELSLIIDIYDGKIKDVLRKA